MAAEESSTTASDPTGGLLFAWRDKRRVLFHLSIFIAFSMILHIGGFYLFQVIYPSSGRLEPESTRVTILNESQPAVATLLKEIEDRLVFLEPASADSDVRVSLNQYAVQFQPSFSDRAVPFQHARPITEIRQLGGPAIAAPLESDVRSDPDLVLPSLPKPANSPAESERVAPDRWTLTGDLGMRSIRSQTRFEERLPRLGGPPSIRLAIAADRSGSIRFVLPVAGESNPALKAVIGAVREYLQFETLESDGDSLQWGWLKIHE